MTFAKAIARVLKHEGGYVNDPDDPGGETNFGISKRSYPDEDIAAMTATRAKEIYKADYWSKPRIGDLPEAVRGSVLDMAVNSGPRRAIKLLQRDLGVTQDGKIGPKTLYAAGSFKSNDLLNSYTLTRIRYYVQISDAKKPLRKFLRGWVKRALGWL